MKNKQIQDEHMKEILKDQDALLGYVLLQRTKKADPDSDFLNRLEKKLMNDEPVKKNITHMNWIGAGIGAFAFLAVIIIFLLANQSNIPQLPNNNRQIARTVTPSTHPLITTQPTEVIKKGETNISLANGFAFYLPENWSAKISSQTKDYFSARFFISGENNEKTYIDIESTNAKALNNNPFLQKEENKQIRINGLAATVSLGKEDFYNSKRQFKQIAVQYQQNYFTATLYDGGNVQAEKQFDTFINSIQQTKIISKSPFSIQKVYAAEAIAGFPKEEYTQIDVMGDPLPERITKNDLQYVDGYAKLYTFSAFKGQRLTTVAMEDWTTTEHSFIRSELYDKDGNSLYKQDTRIEFEAPYTGKYYWIVRSFNSREGGYLLKVFDRNQTENLVYLKYTDGSERLVDPSKGAIQYGEKEVAIIMHFISPVEIIDNKTVRYFIKPKEFESGLGLTTTPLEVFIEQQTYLDMHQQDSQLPENDRNNLIATKLTRLSPSKLIIEPETGSLFPSNRHIAVVERSIGVYRIFTENPTDPSIPTPTSMLKTHTQE